MDKKSLRTLEFPKILERLATYTSFSAGNNLALRVEPTWDFEQARLWQIETNEARHLLDTRTDVTIGGAQDVRHYADQAARGFILQPENLLDIRSTISAARELRRKLEKTRDDYPNLANISELIEQCPGIVSAINGALDDNGEVLDSASPELAKIRRELRIIYGRIQDKLRSLLSSERNQYLQEPTITSRGGRYVVPLKANYKGRIKGIIHDQSNSGATLWIEPMNTIDLNNEYRGLQLAEQEEIQRVLAELSDLVAQHAQSIKRIVERMAELDLIFARARYANAIKATMPEFVAWRSLQSSKSGGSDNEHKDGQPNQWAFHPGSTIWVRGARHPLLDSDSVVPTDLLVDEETFVVLITGPNTGGKTVSLKTTGLMVLMAQAGLHLPAKEARLSVFENIFADIGDEQSIEQNLSTFSGHLTNIVHILKHADDRSLVLLDELGSGTDPAEGAALAQAIVEYLYDKGVTTFVATHFPELKVYASQKPGATNASLLFDVETLMPTYEMSIGMPGRSNALAIARRLGLNESILDEAIQLIGANSDKAEGFLDAIYEMREKITSQEAATRLTLRRIEAQERELQGRLEHIEVERRQVLEQAQKESEEALLELNREIAQVRRKLKDAASINKLKKIQKQTKNMEVEQTIQVDDFLSQIEPKKGTRKPPDLEVGDKVLVTTLGAKGEVVNLDKGEAEVAIGRLRMRVRLEELIFKGREKMEEPSLPTTSKEAGATGMEIDLRGQRVEEGLQQLDQYLDSAYLANLPWVRIIHGKGTGRLREAVRDALKGNNHVISWEEGKDGEGGAGVTVAKLTK